MHDWRARAWGPLALLLSSAGSMAMEIVAGRALAPYVGMSLYSWTAIIAVVLAGLSLGHWLGGMIADRAVRPARAAGLALLGSAILAALAIPALRWAAPLAEGLGPIGRIGTLAAAGFLAPSLIVGLLSPILTAMALRAAPEHARGAVLGRMFALGAAGAILGTVAAGLWLIPTLGAAGAALAAAGLYAALAPPLLGGRAGQGAALALALAVAGGAGFGLPRAFASPCRAESAYYCIRIDETEMYGRAARVMALDHLAHGVNDLAEPRLLLSPYLALVDEAARERFSAPGPSAFFIGGGAYTLPRAWAAEWPDARRVAAEIDPEVTRLAAEFMGFDPATTEVIHRDARRALATLPPGERFDIIFGDAFHDVAAPAHLVTDEFHAEVKRRLNPGGFYAINAVDRLREPRFALSLARTLTKRFAEVSLWLDATELGPEEARATWIILASDTPFAGEERRATRGLRRTWLRVPLDAMLRAVPGAVELTDDFAPVDRLLAPVLLDARLAE